MEQEFPYNETEVSCRETIKGYRRIENGFTSIWFFPACPLGSLLTAIACGIVGTYIVSRRLVFISGGITHASFGGLGLGFYLRMNPILMAMLFSVLSAFGVEWASKTQNVREDSAIAGIWSLGMALGVIFIFLTPGYAPNLSAYLLEIF